MKVWAMFIGPSNDLTLTALYESYDDAQREKDQFMDEQGRAKKPRACMVVGMDTIPARQEYVHELPKREGT